MGSHKSLEDLVLLLRHISVTSPFDLRHRDAFTVVACAKHSPSQERVLMFDLLREDTIRLEEAARIAKSHLTSAYRWVLKGCPAPDGRRIRLEAIRVGRGWLTSRQALERFSAALTPHIEGDDQGLLVRSVVTRMKASEKAGAELERKGF